MAQKPDRIYSFSPKRTNNNLKGIDKNVIACGNCIHFEACSQLYNVGPKTKKCQFEPSKFVSRWVA